MSDKDLFEQLLSDLHESLGKPRTSEAPLRIEPPLNQLPDSFYAAIKEEHDPLMLARQYGFCNGDDVLKVMQSGIFYEGGLKWRKVRGKEDYKTLQVKDLAYFILEATTRLVMPEWERIIRDSISAFGLTINQIGRLEDVAMTYRSKASSNKLKAIRLDLQKIKSTLESMPTPVKPHDLRKKMNRITSLKNLFREQVPGVKDNNIGRAIQSLLDKFDTHVELPAILKQMKSLP